MSVTLNNKYLHLTTLGGERKHSHGFSFHFGEENHTELASIGVKGRKVDIAVKRKEVTTTANTRVRALAGSGAAR